MARYLALFLNAFLLLVLNASGQETYLGCYQDQSSRDLDGTTFAGPSMTIRVCQASCREKGFKFAATQYGAHCFCGNAYGKYGKVDESRCNMGCSGNSAEKCGGSWANSVYQLGHGGRTGRRTSGERRFLGCYQDQGNRDLDGATFAVGDMTAARCETFCRDKGFKFAATQYGAHCFCGNAYGKYGKVDDSRCDMGCSGNAAEKCGGSWANSVYGLSGESSESEEPAEATPGGKRYLGCFEDRGDRDLSGATFAAGDMTTDRCQASCREKGFKFAATQYGAHCFCGNAYGKYGKVDESRCNMGCSGNSAEKCGGSWANSVYELGHGVRTGRRTSGGKRFLGCYQDQGNRDLDGATFAVGDMTAARCETFCRDKGFKFAATQYGAHCFCGNAYGKYGRVDDSRCNMGCSGNSAEKCGGSWANSVYQLH